MTKLQLRLQLNMPYRFDFHIDRPASELSLASYRALLYDTFNKPIDR